MPLRSCTGERPEVSPEQQHSDFTLDQQLQHCCFPADIQRAHYCWASGFDLSPHPGVLCCSWRGFWQHTLLPRASPSTQPSQAEPLQHHHKSSCFKKRHCCVVKQTKSRWLRGNLLGSVSSGASQVTLLFPARAECDQVMSCSHLSSLCLQIRYLLLKPALRLSVVSVRFSIPSAAKTKINSSLICLPARSYLRSVSHYCTGKLQVSFRWSWLWCWERLSCLLC